MNQSLSYEFTQVVPQVVLTGVQVSFCTILVRPATGSEPKVNGAGQVDTSIPDYTVLAGHSNIPCQLAVNKLRPDEGGVIRSEQGYDTISVRQCELNGYYPLILAQHLAQVDGVYYEIMAVESDSQKQITRLAVRLYTK